MSKPVVRELEPDELEEAGKIASMIVGEEEYEHIRSNGGPFQRNYEDLDSVELIELATDVVNGEYPELDERFSYDSENWRVDDFIDAAVEASTTPFSNNQEHSEMRGTTQLEEETYDLSDIEDNANNFVAARVQDEPPATLDYEEDTDKFWIEITYISREDYVKLADFVSLFSMDDRQSPASKAKSQERIYWPE